MKNEAILFATGASFPTKTSPGLDSRHRPSAANGSRNTSKPTWLLALEIVTGTMVGGLILVAAVTTIVKCKAQPHIKIPWKKSASLKEQMNVFVGLISFPPSIGQCS